jgi:endonuclease/exonuclease/phosphatase family metal-dependent hydrolase
MHSITFLVLLLIASSFLATAQERASGKHELLESGRAEWLYAPAAAPSQIKIVSYNIRWRSGKELNQIIDWLKDTERRPSIIALQEVDRARQRSGKKNNARVLAESLGMYYAWAAPPWPKNSNEKEDETGVELLSHYPLSDITRIVLPHAGPGGRWRVALGATIRIGKTDLRVYSVHSETRISVSEKMNQLRAVLHDLARFPKTTPTIVMGDFNSWEPHAIGRVRKLFTSAGFTTPFPDDKTTFKRKIVLFDLELKLDWVWLRGFSAESHVIDRSLTVSDHYPLWTVVKFEK